MDALRNLIDIRTASAGDLAPITHSVGSSDLPFLGPVKDWRLLSVVGVRHREVWLAGIGADRRRVLEAVVVFDDFKGTALTANGGYLLAGAHDFDEQGDGVRRDILDRIEAALEPIEPEDG